MKFDFDKFLPRYQITTPRRRAAFMAQCHHESQGFTRIAENLSYGTQALIRCWPSHFNAKNAGCYAHQPAKIANRAYANRMGNGPEKSGDGWLFRGRGLIQITGRSMYEAFAKFKGMSLGGVITYLGTADGALESACWYWEKYGLNTYADAENIKGMTRVINGGLNGLDDRVVLYRRYLDQLARQTPSFRAGRMSIRREEGMSEQLPERPAVRLSNVTGTDICFHCHSIGRKCTRIDGGLCRVGREE